MTTIDSTDPTTDNDVWFEGAFMRLLVGPEQANGAISVMEHWYPGSWGPPMHVHHREDQVLYVLEGEIRTRLGDGPDATLTAGQAAFLPRDVPHTFITGSDGARVIEINTPGGFEQFHLEAGDPATEQRIPDPKDIDVPRLVAAIEPYDAEFVGPPMS